MLKKWKCGLDKETIDSAEGALRNQLYKDYGKSFHPVNKGKNKEELIDYSIDFLSKGKFRVLNNKNNQIFKKEVENYQWQEGSVEKGKPIPDKFMTNYFYKFIRYIYAVNLWGHYTYLYMGINSAIR